MTEVIEAHGGVIDEFIGDAIFVLFGAPLSAEDDADRAVACAVAMQLKMADVNQHNTEHGWPELQMGIGVHTGEVVVGNIGSVRRSKYGVVGREVNLTSRIESFTVGGQILVSRSTRDAVQASLEIADSFEVTPKGARADVQLFDVVGIGEPWNLRSARTVEPVVPITPVPVALRVIRGKDAGTEPIAAQLTALSRTQARVTAALDPHSNVRLDILGPSGEVLAADLFGKVAADGVHVQLTSRGPDALAVLAGLLTADC